MSKQFRRTVPLCDYIQKRTRHGDLGPLFQLPAETLYGLGERTKARKLQAQVVSGRRRVLGEDHPDTLKAMRNLAQMQ